MDFAGKRTLVVANIAAAALSAGSAVLGMLDPEILLTPGSGSSGVTFYALAYGARAVPLGLAVITLLALRRWGALIPMLALAGLVQVGDAFIGLGYAIPGMVAGSLLGASVHLASTWWLARSRSAIAAVAA
jgi:hypothetical protein